jgi:cytochrome c oxidase subunit 3
MLTGFHGMHVLIGLILLTACLFRLYHGVFRKENHLGLEVAIYYWHFVDVV